MRRSQYAPDLKKGEREESREIEINKFRKRMEHEYIYIYICM